MKTLFLFPPLFACLPLASLKAADLPKVVIMGLDLDRMYQDIRIKEI